MKSQAKKLDLFPTERTFTENKDKNSPYHNIRFLGKFLMAMHIFKLLLAMLLCLRPKSQVVLSFILLDVQIQSLLKLIVVHPHHVASRIQYNWTSRGAIYRRAPRGEEEIPIIAPVVPLGDLWFRRLIIDRMEMLTGIDTMKAQIIRVEGESFHPDSWKGR